LTDFADGGVDAMLGVHKDFTVPQALDDFGSGDEMAIPGCQQNEQLHRFSFQLEGAARARQLKAVAIHLEVAEFKDSEWHGKAPPRVKYSIRFSDMSLIAFHFSELPLYLIFTSDFTASSLRQGRKPGLAQVAGDSPAEEKKK
jgi:hypothetical protein